jgi:[NiFe] hydrogenase diaphorase moiety small subunit
MSEPFDFTLDGATVTAQSGETIMQAADRAGIYIPRLCAHKELHPFGACRICTVLVNGRPQSSCTQPAAPGIVVENDTEALRNVRKSLVEMLFVEGNHYCMFCEKSGLCELQALGYRFGLLAPRYPYQFPKREMDASHPDLFVDRNRCVQCARCVRASRELDHKTVFEFSGRGAHKAIAVNADARLADTDVNGTDRAIDVCPVGCLLRKRYGFRTPIGQRKYDHQPIGSDIEAGHPPAAVNG